MSDQREGMSSGRGREDRLSVGDFYIDSEIGKGSFANVYMAMHKDTKAIVAVKSVDVERLTKKLKENLYGEIQILKTLRHPHIVALHDCVESPTHINLIMEYCELGDLSLFIKKREKLITHPATHDLARKYPCSPNSGLHEVVIRHFLKQLASALQFLRDKNYVHRDVKPQNLLLLPAPHYRQANSRPILSASQDSLIPVAGLSSLPMLKLADFGFARVLPSTSLADTLCGSPLYMAPEILRYERYDAKADLWSVGTVLFEMVTGRPPTKAKNHVELLRKIEASQDIIKFPREAIVSAEMKALIRSLLKRQGVERLSFEAFFSHPVVVGPIPGLVEDDIPPKPISRTPSARTLQYSNLGSSFSARRLSRQAVADGLEISSSPRSPREPHQHHHPAPLRSAQQSPVETTAAAAVAVQGRAPSDAQPRNSYSSSQERTEGLGIRPKPHTAATAPARPSRLSNASTTSRASATAAAAAASNEAATQMVRTSSRTRQLTEAEKAAQEVALERDYVHVDKQQVMINALADDMDAKRRSGHAQSSSPTSAAIVRRNTHQGVSGSPTATGSSPRNIQAAPGRDRGGHESSGTPTASSISKAIQNASLRLFGYDKFAARLGKGPSPPIYSPFPAYPSSATPAAGVIGDGRSILAMDNDGRTAQAIEDCAHRSDVVYGFAEVKFKQIFPDTPSMDHGLGVSPKQGSSDNGDVGGRDDDDDLTVDAVVLLCEEAFVLYFKVLTLLARVMDTANAWWLRRKSGESGAATTASSGAGITESVSRVNAVVQWVRSRFNEVLEKTEMVQLKLVDGQKRLPEDHACHPNNRENEVAASGSAASGSKAVFLSPGISAEKLMYDRALEMSRAAAIHEITHENLPGCELSYVTAIRMLEVVVDTDEENSRNTKTAATSGKPGKEESHDDISTQLNNDDRQSVRKMIQMITSRLSAVRKKIKDIDEARTYQIPLAQQIASRRRSGDVTPRSIPSA